MAVNLANFSHSIFHFQLPHGRYLPAQSRKRFRCPSALMNSGDEFRAKFMEFPYVSGPHRNLMVELKIALDPRCNLELFRLIYSSSRMLVVPPGLQCTSDLACLRLSWIHCELSSGGALNITSLSAYLRPMTDAPHFLLDLIQSSPTSLVLVLDLTPRKDLIMYPEYLKTYYEDTQLDRHRQRLHELPEVRPYISPSLYIRVVLSPTAIIASIDVGSSAMTKVDDIIQEHVDPITKELLQLWIDSCASLERHVEEPDKAYLAERDRVIKNKTIEVDLGSSFPRLFGQDVAERTLGVLKEYYNN